MDINQDSLNNQNATLRKTSRQILFIYLALLKGWKVEMVESKKFKFTKKKPSSFFDTHKTD